MPELVTGMKKKTKPTHLISEVLRVKTKQMSDLTVHGLILGDMTSHTDVSLYFLFPSKHSQSHLASMTVCHS